MKRQRSHQSYQRDVYIRIRWQQAGVWSGFFAAHAPLTCSGNVLGN